MRKLLIMFASLGVCAGAAAQTYSDPIRAIDAARDVFDKYTHRLAAHDPSLLHLYTKDARIRTLQIQASGSPDYKTIPFATYAEQLHSEFKAPKSPSYTFSNTHYQIDGVTVTIDTQRHSSNPDYTGDFTIKVRSDGHSHWLIVDQLTELPSLYVLTPTERKKDMTQPLPTDSGQGDGSNGSTGDDSDSNYQDNGQN